MSGKDRAERLLDAHVAHVVETLSGEGFADWLSDTVSATIADASRLKLEDAVPRKQVKAAVAEVADELVTAPDFRLVIEQVARAVLESGAHDDATIGDLIEETVYEAGRDKAVAMHKLREAAVRSLLESRAYRGFVADLLYNGIRGWATNNPLTQSVPGAKRAFALGRSVISRARPGIEDSLDRKLHDYVDKSVDASAEIGAEHLLGIEDAEIRRAADAVWSHVSQAPISEVLAAVDGNDAEDWAGIVHDGLQHLRGTDWFARVVADGVDAYFDHYGKHTLDALLADIGVTEAIIEREIRRFAQPVIKLLKRKKLLEPAIRRQLAPFYESEAARAILDD